MVFFLWISGGLFFVAGLVCRAVHWVFQCFQVFSVFPGFHVFQVFLRTFVSFRGFLKRGFRGGWVQGRGGGEERREFRFFLFSGGLWRFQGEGGQERKGGPRWGLGRRGRSGGRGWSKKRIKEKKEKRSEKRKKKETSEKKEKTEKKKEK